MNRINEFNANSFPEVMVADKGIIRNNEPNKRPIEIELTDKPESPNKRLKQDNETKEIKPDKQPKIDQQSPRPTHDKNNRRTIRNRPSTFSTRDYTQNNNQRKN